MLSDTNQELQIQENSSEGVVIKGLMKKEAYNEEDGLNCVFEGES